MVQGRMEKEMRWRKLMVKKGADDHATWRVGKSKISEGRDATWNAHTLKIRTKTFKRQSSLITQVEFLYYIQNLGENRWGKTPYL